MSLKRLYFIHPNGRTLIMCCDRYHDAGRLSDQQMALLQYQRENLHFLSEEVSHLDIGGCTIVLNVITCSFFEVSTNDFGY